MALVKKISSIITACCIVITVQAQDSWSSAQVRVTGKGNLHYKADAKGNTLPDFSRTGYFQGSKAIPLVPVVKTVAPDGKNDLGIVQAAIDEVANRVPDSDGFRGAILLTKGVYAIPGTIKIRASGIVLRGEGPATRVIATGKGQRDLINAMGKGEVKEIAGTRSKITDKYVPVGATSFTVKRTTGLNAGDKIIVYRPGTQKWISDLQMDKIETGQNTKQWEPAEYDLKFERVITRIEKNKIYIDNPIVMAMEEQYGGGEIYKYSFEGRLQQVGVEDLLCESEYSSDTDEDHGWVAVSFNRVENSWVKNVTAKHFGYSAVHLGDKTKQVTVSDCRYIEPKSQITGGRRYSFNNDGQLNLFIHCFASEGRHDYVTGARVAGPNVFYNCRSENAKGDIGPHHRWAVGTLYDNIITDGDINIQDRGNWGTGHGWAGVTQVLWNCTADKAAVQSPWVSGKNYAIGLQGKKYSGRLNGRPDGEWEGQNKQGLTPASLYLVQVAERKKQDAGAMEREASAVLYPQVLKEAELVLTQPPLTITAYPAARSAGGPHDFFSEGDYWWPDPRHPDSPYVQRDGMTNPENFTAHREAMIRFSRIVGVLATAYKLTGDKKYVVQALQHCKAWFIDSATLMNPSLLYAQAIKGRFTGRGIGIIDTVHLMEIVKGLLAMQDAGVIDAATWQSLQQWFARYLDWLTTHPYGKQERDAKNNHGTCWVMQVAVFAQFTQDKALLDFCRERFKNLLLPEQMAADGSFPLEIKRTKPYGYSIFNLDAMATIAQTLSTKEHDLWNYTVNGKSLVKGIAFLYPYVANKSKWPYAKDVMYWNDWPIAQPFLLFGANQLNNKQWMNTWEKLEHAPQQAEVIRNLPVRNPLLWLN